VILWVRDMVDFVGLCAWLLVPVEGGQQYQGYCTNAPMANPTHFAIPWKPDLVWLNYAAPPGDFGGPHCWASKTVRIRRRPDGGGWLTASRRDVVRC